VPCANVNTFTLTNALPVRDVRGMTTKSYTDWLYRWCGECESRPAYFWHVDTDWMRKRRLAVLFPFCFVASLWCICRNFVHGVENRLYTISKRRNKQWYKDAYEHGYQIGRAHEKNGIQRG